MRKFLGLLLFTLLTLPIFSKEIPLQVTSTEWGMEISNVNSKGKTICTDYLKIYEYDAFPFIILKKANDIFNVNNLIEEIKAGIFDIQSGGTVLTISENSFTQIHPDNYGYEPHKYAIYNNIAEYNSILIIFNKYEIIRYKAYCEKNDLYLLLQPSSGKTKLGQILEDAATIEANNKRLAEENKKNSIKEKYLKSNKEGYDNLPWETSIEEFLLLHPEGKKISDEKPFERYQINRNSGAEMTYYFYNGKLVKGTTYYKIDDGDKNAEIINRLKELYGQPTSAKDLSKKEYGKYDGYDIPYTYCDIRVMWNKSPTFNIESATIGQYADDIPGLDFNVKVWFAIPFGNTITYSNDKQVKEIMENFEKQKKTAEEAEKRKRMENLDL